MKLKIGRTTVPVANYAEASAIWCRHREDHNLRSSTSPRVQVVEDDGTLRHVSYNGRIWAHATGADWRMGDQPIFDNCEH